MTTDTPDVLALREALLDAGSYYLTPDEHAATLDALIAAVRAETLAGSGVVERRERDYADSLGEALLAMGHHNAARHQSPNDYDAESSRACGIMSCLLELIRDVNAGPVTAVMVSRSDETPATPPTPALTAARLAQAMRKAWGPYWLTDTDDHGQPYEHLDVDAYAAAIIATLATPPAAEVRLVSSAPDGFHGASKEFWDALNPPVRVRCGFFECPRPDGPDGAYPHLTHPAGAGHDPIPTCHPFLATSPAPEVER